MRARRDEDAVHLWLLLTKAWQALAAHARRHIAGLDLCPSDFAVLEALLHQGPLTVQVIGAKVLLTSGSMTAAVDRLAARGLVARRVAPGDRRARLVALTPRGRALIARAFAAHAGVLEEAAAALGPRERATLAALLKKLGRGAAARPVVTGTAGKPAARRPSPRRPRERVAP